MRIAITGGTGFIGHHLVTAHLEKGDDVTVLARKKIANPEKGLSYIKGDLLDKQLNFSAFVDNADIPYHCAGELSDEKLMPLLHIESTDRLLQATLLETERSGNAIHWVQLSSVGAHGPSLSGANVEGIVTEETATRLVGPYETTKIKSDNLVM